MKKFLDFIFQKAEYLRHRKDFIHVYSHHDADGITSGAIIAKTLSRIGKEFNIRIVDMIDNDLLDEIKTKKGLFLFLDLGSGYLDSLRKTGKRIMIIDHHIPKGDKKGLIHINPLDFGLEPFSGSTIAYLFSKALGKQEGLSSLAIVGARGDRQKPIEQIKNNVEEKQDLRVFGKYLRSIPRALSLSLDPFIPGIFGDEGAAVEFLKAIDIEPIKNDELRSLSDLDEEEKKSLVAGIIMRRKDMEDPENIFGTNHYLEDYKVYAEEFSTVLNAASRMGKPGLAISLCFKKNTFLKRMKNVMEKYSQEIGKEFSNIDKKQKSETLFVFGQNQKIIGTISSLLLAESEKPNVIGMAPRKNKVKISARTRGEINLGGLLAEIAQKLEGFGGGHRKAAGALIPREKKQDFINLWENYLNTKLEF